ncbi:MAG: hypothetical protein QM536_01275 [Chitinophagaceae bacterium]|nr:hypothetical protein [Chitinophagaceae bacterium]
MFSDTRTIQELEKNILLLQEQIVALQKENEEREEAHKKLESTMDNLGFNIWYGGRRNVY